MKRLKNNRYPRAHRQSGSLAYEALEARCVLTGYHQVNVPFPEGVNAVQNSDFALHSETLNHIYASNQVTGWNGIQAQQWTKQDRITLRPAVGLGHVLELGTTAGSQDSVYQNVSTTRGARYLLSFDFRTNPSGSSVDADRSQNISEFEVRFNGQLIAVARPNQMWKTMTVEVIGGNADTSQLMFSSRLNGLGPHLPGIGALINNVRLIDSIQGTIQSGNFEQFRNAPPLAGQSLPSNAVPGWNAIGPNPDHRTIRIEPTNSLTKTMQGNYVLNLNANQGFRDAVFQELETEPNAYYYVNFLARGNGDRLQVSWNNQWALTTIPDGQWESIGILVQATSSQTRLMFMEANPGSGSMWLDNVRIFKVPPPELNLRANPPETGQYQFASLIGQDDWLSTKKKEAMHNGHGS